MLNELEELRHSLSGHGIQTTPWHPWIKPLAKYTTLLLELSRHGAPAAVSVLSRERAATLRNIQPDNQKSFPAFNLNSPLFEMPVSMDPTTISAAALVEVLPRSRLAYEKKDLDRLKRLLHEFPAQEIEPILATAEDPVLDSTHQLLAVLTLREGSAEDFLRQLALVLLQAALQGDIPLGTVLDVLFGKLTKKGSRESWQCIAYLDLVGLQNVSHRVADEAVAAGWSEAMLSSARDLGTQIETVSCALSGEIGAAIGDKMPNPNLPLLGGTYLFSMNSDIPCQSRYRQTSTRLFSVTRQAIQRVNDALLHATKAELRGRTWGTVPNGNSEKADLLISYLESEPEGNLRLAEVMGDTEDGDEEEIWAAAGASAPPPSNRMSPYAARLTRLIEALQLRARPVGVPDDHLRLFVLSTIDKGRKQVLFDARYRIDRIFAARERWVAGASNAPAVRTQLMQGKGKKTLETSVRVPSPATVVRSFRDQWIRLGERSQKVSGVSLGRIYKLLLDEDPRREALWLLERFLPLKLNLLIAAGLPARNERTGENYSYAGAALSGVARLDLLTTLAVLGILLRALGREKETYMKDRDFLLGQLLQFADRIHLFYCEGVRGGQVPPQLIGNAHISMAMQSPRRALEVLAERMPVYLAYAKQIGYSKQDTEVDTVSQHRLTTRVRTARWLERNLGELSSSLQETGLEQDGRPTGKAELLLGYLATPPQRTADANDVGKNASADGSNEEVKGAQE